MFQTPTALSTEARQKIIKELSSVLEDGLALQLLLYFAHWNVKGMAFAALHPFFGELSEKAYDFNDTLAERIVILGGKAEVSVARLAPGTAVEDEALVKVVSRGVKEYLDGLNDARKAVQGMDEDTEQLLIDAILAWNKYGWQLLASVGGKEKE
jgi:starvation-inducible DNA-binding protein